MSNELITLENLSPPEVFKTDKVTEILNYVEQRIKEFVPCETTPAGLAEIDEFAWKITKSKTLLVNMGDDYAKFLKSEPKRVDVERKRIKDTLEGWAKQVRKPVTDREDAEKERIAVHVDSIIGIGNYLHFTIFASAEEIEKHITELKAFCASRDWQEYMTQATVEYTRVNSALTEMLNDRKQKDADHAELERLRKEEEERNREKRESEIAAKATKDAEDKARQEAERVAAESDRAIRAERDKADQLVRDAQAVQERADAAIKKEKDDAIAAQKAKDAADVKRQADQEHVAKVNHAVILGIVDIDRPELTTELAQVILTAIAEGKIPHVSVKY